ncbi:type II toxin-antitoxin system HigB family toxin [Nostoc sp. UHCC 0252]|uniref:type II toxin-antitoxin system HigB family toxin n=1 Tax=Nostoc sp. UHCC 0252 TaxID=3110241 RepID=UPI002B20C0FB|nr:type II toxin-antitoxin system HigB family toxin [Nostoc sp. UHCC 0252]MEA5603550.1 type II toxin-antitoxin system HigB family toxin [Nostoc sp. UHCC 0252]
MRYILKSKSFDRRGQGEKLYCIIAGSAVSNWYKVATKAKWSNLVEVQQVFPKAEAVGNFTVFNIKGNKYRLIVSIDYQGQLIYIKYILIHAEYDKENWKDDPYF